MNVRKLAALLLGTLLALGLVQGVRTLREARREARVEERRREIEELVAENAEGVSPAEVAAEAPAPAAEPPPLLTDPTERRYYLDEETSEKLFYRDRGSQMYDPWTYYRPKPDLHARINWTEHPNGAWTYDTNSVGMREDDEPLEHADFRVLVTGDSHTEGFCDNAESFANLLEAALREGRPGEAVEVLNAANGGFSFYNYLGVLEKHLHLGLDAFVVGVYGGNDFLDLLLQYAWFERFPLPERPPEEFKEFRRGERISSQGMTQSFHSVVYFRNHPEMVDKCVEGSVRLMREMHELCRAHGVPMICVYIPPALEYPAGKRAEEHEAMVKELALTDDDFARVSGLADTFLAGVVETGIVLIDMRERFDPATGPYYWDRDYHMNTRAHHAIAEALAERASVSGKVPPPKPLPGR